MIYDKTILEKRARVTLEEVCGYAENSLICADKPDLQDIKRSYGIEVVEDCYQNEKQAERFVEGVWGKNISDVKPKKVRRFEESGGCFQQKNGKIVSALLSPSTPNNSAHLIETIQGKIDKLNNGGYKAFQFYGLYVFVDTMTLFSSYVQGVVERVAEYQANKDYVYETMYLDGYYEMCVCDIKSRSFSKIEMNRGIRDKIERKTLCHD